MAIKPILFNTISTHMPLARHDVMRSAPFAIFTFLLTCLLRGMTALIVFLGGIHTISTHMPLARHDLKEHPYDIWQGISTHMPLARHDLCRCEIFCANVISTHMPLARHDYHNIKHTTRTQHFYSHASCEA